MIVPEQAEPVLLGSAILGARAAGAFTTLEAAMAKMTGPARVIEPNADAAPYHARKYAVFLKMQDDFAAYRSMMSKEEL